MGKEAHQDEVTGCRMPKGPQKRLTENEKAKMRTYHIDYPNMSYRKLGEVFGCSKTTAYRIITQGDTLGSGTG
ncbi:hypothetical protein BGX34_000244 [Mortierella sp. NVP85]|nr:hypothetical protein BGX34_000244 [Mortierella sp. NVP85]